MNEKNRWFSFALEDLKVAEISLEEGIYNQACFHSQQGVEKMLKGYLAENDKDVPKIHSIGALLKICGKIDRGFEKMTAKCSKLDDYYIPLRYPDIPPGMLPDGMPGKEDAREAVYILEEVMKFVEKKVKNKD